MCMRTHIFVYNNAATSSLRSDYLCPYFVKYRAPKYFDVDINGTAQRISIDRRRPRFILNDNKEQPLKSSMSPSEAGSTPQRKLSEGNSLMKDLASRGRTVIPPI
ncbi:hypothetical protein CDAR_615311 [Caerostris darwini]|uniref:Uncharacterized protein n=1 Tax=Caerostris darwini TaxID=1538125 RepID=A0AAV4RS47_9ARAC|nr:hypothetical protein CDAR_615311 [Caerostris darwini]